MAQYPYRRAYAQNGDEYLVTDDNRVSWSANAVLGAVNIFKWSGSSYSAENLSITVNSDKTIDIDDNGGASYTYRLLQDTGHNLQWMNDLWFSGLSDGNSTDFMMRVVKAASPWTVYARCTTEPVQISGIPDNSDLVNVDIYIGAGKTIDTKVKPMISVDKNAVYAPPAMTNGELTEQVAVEDISSDFVTLGENISFGESYSVYKIGKLIICHLVLKRTGNFPEGDYNAIATINSKYLPKKDINGICNWAYTEWSGVITPGYLWLANNTGYINLKQSSATAQTVAKIDICYVSK